MKRDNVRLLSTVFFALACLGFAVAQYADRGACPVDSRELCLEHDLEGAPLEETDAAEVKSMTTAQGADTRPAAIVKKPDAAPAPLLIVGSKAGTMEPCGCTGGQLGGLAKLKTQLDLLCQVTPGAVLIDGGGLTKGDSAMEKIRGEVMAGIYQGLPNTVVALGPNDLASGMDEAVIRAQIMADPSLTARFPNAVQVNIATGQDVKGPIANSAIVSTKSKTGTGSRVLVCSVIPDPSDAGKAVNLLREELTRNAGKFDLFVCVFHGFDDGARALGAAVPELDFVIVGEGMGTPDDKPRSIGNTLYMHPGQKGRHVVRLTLERKGGSVQIPELAIDVIQTNIPADPTTAERITAYRAKLAENGIVKSLANQRKRPELGYAGSEACKQCHISAYAVWEKSKHAHAVESMVARQGDKDPDCLKCHALGWYSEPPSGEVQGYKGDDVKSKLASVACESCHGPALRHTKTPYTVKPMKDVTCQKCHDIENSPEFDRAKFWPKIFHEKDKP